MLRLTIAVVALSVGLAAPQAPARPQKNVLVLLGDDLSLPVVAQIWNSVQSHLKSPEPSAVNVYMESLDVSRFGSADYPPQVARWYRQKYRSIRPDVIVTVAVPALAFMLEQRRDLWSGIPIVAGAITSPQISGIRLPEDVTPVFFGLPYERTLEVALTALPQTRRVAVVSGSAPRDSADLAQLRALESKTRNYLEWSYLTGLSTDELKSKLAGLPDRTIVLWTIMTADSVGRSFIPAFEAVAALAPTSSAPVFGIYPPFVGVGIVGGTMMDPTASGREIAETARSVIGLPSTSTLPFAKGGVGTPSFDWRQLQKWGIPEDRLPKGSQFLFREPSLMESHGELVIVASVALLMLTALVVFLFLERSRRATAQVKLKSLAEELRRLSAALLMAQEDERSRIARELHDDISQRLALLAIETSQLGQKPGTEDIGTELEELAEVAAGLSTDVHRLAHGLHPAKLDLLGLLPVVKRHCQEMERVNGIEVELTSGNLPANLSRETSLCLYRVIQESLANVVRHSKAKLASVDLRTVDGTVVATIADNGVGYNPGSDGVDSGLGIVSMRERLRLVHGSISFRLLPGAGTEVKATVPTEVAQP